MTDGNNLFDAPRTQAKAEHVLMADPNHHDEWVLHPECYRDLVEDWSEPV